MHDITSTRRRSLLTAASASLAAPLLPRGAAATPACADAPTLDAAGFAAARRFVATPQGDIACIDRGQGDAALFLHGFPLSAFQWRDAIARLASHRRCLAPDFLGLGATRVAAGQAVDPLSQVDMLVALLDALGVASADVIASDSGAAVAQLLVARHPQRVRTLLLTNCDEEQDCPPPALLPVIELAKQGRWVDEWIAPWYADRTLARSPQGIGGLCYANPAHPTDAAIDAYFAPLLSSPERKALANAYAVALERNALAGIGPQLARCEAPVRIVWGTADDIFHADSPQRLHRAFGNSHGIRRLPGSKLFWPEERPDVVASEALALWGIG